MSKVCPFSLFKKWFEQASRLPLTYPMAMVLSTVGKDRRSSSRIVLLKEWNLEGFVFFTNYGSRKAIEIEENGFASLLFYWEALEKQIRIEGRVEKISPERSATYFKSRPQESRLGAWASKQSQVLTDRDELSRRLEAAKERFPDEIPLPEFWGGYCLIPDYFEFWQSGEFRLHERTVFEKKGDEWTTSLLFP